MATKEQRKNCLRRYTSEYINQLCSANHVDVSELSKKEGKIEALSEILKITDSDLGVLELRRVATIQRCLRHCWIIFLEREKRTVK